jgi:hypothetical protein
VPAAWRLQLRRVVPHGEGKTKNEDAGAIKMNTTKMVPGLKVKSSIKSAGLAAGNHNRTLALGLKVKSSIKSAGLAAGNHNRTLHVL